MKRNVILGLRKVDWSDVTRQSEYVNSVVSALNGLGENLDYDYVCAVSGSAFRTSFSAEGWNHGNYHVANTPSILAHTFKMLGYNVSQHTRSDYEIDSKLIMDSIDKGIPVITLKGVINCSDTCLISGYDDDGRVLLGGARLWTLMTITRMRRTRRVISERRIGTTASSRIAKDKYSSSKANARSLTNRPSCRRL